MNYYFLDTSYLIASEIEDDQHHKIVSEHWKELGSRQNIRLVTTSFILAELAAGLSKKPVREIAIRTCEWLRTSQIVDLIYVDENLFDAGWNLYKNRLDKEYSLTDCISFEVMRQHKIDIALTTDSDFVQEGFQGEPCK